MQGVAAHASEQTHDLLGCGVRASTLLWVQWEVFDLLGLGVGHRIGVVDPVDLRRLEQRLGADLEGAQRIVGTRLAQSGAALVIDLPDEELYVAADVVQLEQVLVNLIGNACDVLQGRPVRQIRVGARHVGAEVQLQVHDSGPGIAEENLDMIFDPFFTTSDAGLGLGLSISHTIAQRLGGSLSAANAPDGGAVFTLTLDAWPQQA
mgnify:CR=1 FL=1